MNNYILKATRGESESTIRIRSKNDFEATLDSIQAVLNNALKHDIWARGKVDLTDESGNVIHSMEEKTD